MLCDKGTKPSSCHLSESARPRHQNRSCSHLVDDVVAEGLLAGVTEVVVIHEAQDQLEEGQRLLIVRLFSLGQERSADRLPLHAPQVGLVPDYIRSVNSGNIDWP